jgi:hypothetical protein
MQIFIPNSRMKQPYQLVFPSLQVNYIHIHEVWHEKDKFAV